MMRWLLGLGVLAACFGYAAPAAVTQLVIKTGTPVPFYPRYLDDRDGELIELTSRQVVNSQVLEFSLKLPTPELPEDLGNAAVALAVQGNRAHPVNASVWLPKSRVWQKLQTDYLPTDAKGFLLMRLFRAEAALAGEQVELLVRIEDHGANAEPITVKLDAAKVLVAARKPDPENPHEAALRSGGDQPHVRVHQFAGETSGNYESRANSISKGFREKKPAPPKKKNDKKKRNRRR